MANKIKLAGTTSNNFQIGLQGVTLYSNRATSPYNLSLPSNVGSSAQVLISDGSGNLNWSNSAISAGTVTDNAQPNITSLGILTSLSVSGNANVGNLGSGNGEFTGNVLLGSGVGGSLTGPNLVSANFFTGTLTTSAQPNITSVGTLTSLSVSGNANVGNIGATNGVFTNISGNGAGLTSISGANITGAVANATTAQTVTDNAQPNITSTGTLTSLTVSGNAIAGNLSSQGTVNVGTAISMTASGGAIVTGPGLSGSGTGGVLRIVASANQAFIQSGIYNTSNSAAPLIFTTIFNGREWMRLDANGNLGVNINAPTSTLHVSGTSNITGAATFGNAISVGNSNTFNFSTLNILNTNLYDSDPNVGIAYGTATANAVNTGQSYAWRQRATGNAIAGISSVTESIVRDGTWTERMRITSDGTLSITGNANIGNLNLTGNILDTTGPLSIVTTSNGNINLSPNGTGIVNVSTSLAANANITSSNGFFVSGNSALGYWLNVTGNNVGKLYYNAGAVKVEATDATSNVQIAANGTSRITVFANGLSTINGALSASGNVTGGNLIATNYIVRSVTTGVTAAGSTQGTATALTRDINIVNTVAPSANGVILPTAVSGMMLTIVNTTANTLQVYPASGAAIDALAANAAFSMVGNARIQFAAATGTLWYSI